jgi:hypothetical protein
VECVEQRKHVDETPHLVDLDGVNVAGINKVRFRLVKVCRGGLMEDAAPSFYSSKATC